MSRYIDADVVKEELKQNTPQYMWGEVLTTVNIQPYIDLVRCKECEWSVEDDYIMKCWNIKGLNKTDGVVNPDDFCSYGERRASRWQKLYQE